MPVFGNNGIRTFGALSYGDLNNKFLYEFPPTYTLSFNTKPIMSDNGVTVKYNRNELTVTWFVPHDIVYIWAVDQNGNTDTGQNPQSTPSGGNSPVSIDTTIQRIRAILMTPRLLLRCEYQGLGPEGNATNYGLTINSTNDLNHGPTPVDFKWRNIAAQKCVEMTWVVAFHTHNQIIFDGSNYVNKVPTIFNELSWSRSYDIDEIGAVTITTSGRYTINSYVPEHTDSYRVVAGFPVPLYCQRVSQKFQHDSNSKSTSFTLVDKQFPTENALPPKCIKMDLTHEVSSAIFGGRLEGKGFHQWNNVIQGSITLAPGEPFVYAYLMFWFFARQRLYRVQPSGLASKEVPIISESIKDGKNETKSIKVRTIVTKVSYKESLFDRTHTFRLEYLGVYSRKKLLQQSGLFTPLYNFKVDGSNGYKYWYEPEDDNDREPWHGNFPRPTSPVGPDSYTSLANQWSAYQQQFGNSHPNYSYLPRSAWNVYGYTAMNESDVGPWIFYPDDQTPDQVKINKAVHGINLPAWVYPPDSPITGNQSQDFMTNYETFDPEASYISHENTFSIIEDVNTFQVVRQSYNSVIDSAMKSFNGEVFPLKSTKVVNLHGVTPSIGNGLPTSDYVASYNSQPVTKVVMSGYSVRAAYPPSIPVAFRYKGTSLVRAGQSIVNMRQLAKGDIPIYIATWSIPYYANTSVHTNFFADLNLTGFAGDLA